MQNQSLSSPSNWWDVYKVKELSFSNQPINQPNTYVWTVRPSIHYVTYIKIEYPRLCIPILSTFPTHWLLYDPDPDHQCAYIHTSRSFSPSVAGLPHNPPIRTKCRIMSCGRRMYCENLMGLDRLTDCWGKRKWKENRAGVLIWRCSPLAGGYQVQYNNNLLWFDGHGHEKRMG